MRIEFGSLFFKKVLVDLKIGIKLWVFLEDLDVTAYDGIANRHKRFSFSGQHSIGRDDFKLKHFFDLPSLLLWDKVRALREHLLEE